MYTFFTILGILFVITASVLINYIYKIFSINAITNFLHPTNGNRVINEINITVLPIILWSFIELPVLGKNDNFVFAVILNIIVSCAIMYEVKYGLYVVVKLENTFSEVLAIIMASVIGQGVAFMILKSMPFFNFTNFEYLISIISLIALFIIICILQYISKRGFDKYKKVILSPNGELYKFIREECENEETIRKSRWIYNGRRRSKAERPHFRQVLLE